MKRSTRLSEIALLSAITSSASQHLHHSFRTHYSTYGLICSLDSQSREEEPERYKDLQNWLDP